MKITIIAGARPNFMKIAPIVRAINHYKENGKEISFRLIYTGSQDDISLDASLFSDLDMPQPDICLNAHSNSFAEWAAEIMVAFEKDLKENPTDVVMVVDDLTPTMACSLIAKKQKITVAHLVAGTRSFDINTPKEVNRIVTDTLSDILFTAGRGANRNLSQVGTSDTQVYFVGNILVDSLRYNRNRFIEPILYSLLHLEKKKYYLLTLNRKVIIKNQQKLRDIIETVIKEANGQPIIAPIHNYVKEAIEALNLEAENLHLFPTQSYLNFGYLLNNSKGVITDSGNIAEEATFLNVPCITLNTFAEHMETCKIGTNVLIGEDTTKLKDYMARIENNQWKDGQLPEQWDGRTAERIVQVLMGYC